MNGKDEKDSNQFNRMYTLFPQNDARVMVKTEESQMPLQEEIDLIQSSLDQQSQRFNVTRKQNQDGLNF